MSLCSDQALPWAFLPLRADAKSASPRTHATSARALPCCSLTAAATSSSTQHLIFASKRCELALPTSMRFSTRTLTLTTFSVSTTFAHSTPSRSHPSPFMHLKKHFQFFSAPSRTSSSRNRPKVRFLKSNFTL